MRDLGALLDLAERAAREAGAHTRRGPEDVRFKGDVDLVTAVDLACEAAIRERLAQETPGIPVYAEEGGGAEGAATRWIVDPLDGTTNFVHGFPFYCVSIALQDAGALQVGAIYDPVRDRCFRAAAGRGAWVDGTRLRVSDARSLQRSLVASGFMYDRRERPDFYLAFVRAMLIRAQGFRRCGSAAMDLATAAAGQLDGYWEFGLNAWDVAAGALLVTEAGGRVSDLRGAPLDVDRPVIVATNGWIHDEMLSALREVEGTLPPTG